MRHFNTGETKPNGKPRIVGREWSAGHAIPDGWTEISMSEVAELTSPTEAEQRDIEIARIDALLEANDKASIRPIRDGEQDRVDELKAEAAALRAERAAL